MGVRVPPDLRGRGGGGDLLARKNNAMSDFLHRYVSALNLQIAECVQCLHLVKPCYNSKNSYIESVHIQSINHSL